MPMHNDFKKILAQFIARYGSEKGTRLFYSWVNSRKLDDTKAYSIDQLKRKECLTDKCKHNCAKCLQESFQWAKPLIKLLKNDATGKTYQVEAHFAVTSMNRNVYTEEELSRAISTLPNKSVNLNHNPSWTYTGVSTLAAAWESDCAECLIHVENGAVDAKGRDVQETIDNGVIDCVSIEGDGTDAIQTAEGNMPVNFSYSGLALLDQDALPGIPLTTIKPLEKIMESIYTDSESNLLLDQTQNENEEEVNKSMSEKHEEKPETENPSEDPNEQEPQGAQATYCPICGAELVDGVCPNKDCSAYGKTVEVDQEKLLNQNTELTRKVADLTEKLTATITEKSTVENALSKAREQIADLSGKLSEALKDNEKIGIGESLSKTLKEQLATVKSENNTLRGSVEAKAKENLKLEENVNKEHAKRVRVEEELGKANTELEATRRELNGESTKRAAAEQKSLNETNECSRIKRANAQLLEEKAVDTRSISDLSSRLSEAANKQLVAEKELAEAKTVLAKHEAERKELIEKALFENKKAYKYFQKLRENGIVYVDTEGNVQTSP